METNETEQTNGEVNEGRDGSEPSEHDDTEATGRSPGTGAVREGQGQEEEALAGGSAGPELVVDLGDLGLREEVAAATEPASLYTQEGIADEIMAQVENETDFSGALTEEKIKAAFAPYPRDEQDSLMPEDPDEEIEEVELISFRVTELTEQSVEVIALMELAGCKPGTFEIEYEGREVLVNLWDDADLGDASSALKAAKREGPTGPHACERFITLRTARKRLEASREG